MSAPNMLNVSNCYGNTSVATLATGTVANVITNASGSNSVIKLDAIILTNYSGSSITANVILNRSSTSYYLAGNLSISANSQVTIVNRNAPIYLIEGDVIQANSSAGTACSMVASYETLS